MRASRILQLKPERAIVALAQLCEERKEEELLHPQPHNGLFIPPRLSPLPPQVPYTVNSSPMRPPRLPVADQVSPSTTNPPSPSSPPTASSGPSSPPQKPQAPPPVNLPIRLDQLEHMAPKRTQWTSPPPPDAPEEDRSAFENRLGQSLSLATTQSPLRQAERPRPSHATSSNASEAYTDDEARSDVTNSDDVRSVQSFVEEGAPSRRREKERENDREPTVTLERQQLRQMHTTPIPFADPSSSRSPFRQESGMDPRMLARIRGRPAMRLAQQLSELNASAYADAQRGFTPPPRIDSPRRSLSGPARTTFPQRLSQMAIPTYIPNRSAFVSLADYQSPQQTSSSAYIPNGNIFYETTPPKEKLSRTVPYPFNVNLSPMSPISPQQPFELRNYYDTIPIVASGSSSSPSSSPRHMSTVPSQMSSPRQSSPRQSAPRHLPPSLRRSSKLAQPTVLNPPPRYETSTLSPTTVTYAHAHSHTHSSGTVTSTTPRAHMQSFADSQSLSPSLSRSRSPAHSPAHSRPHSRQQLPPRLGGSGGGRPTSPFASISSGSASPPMSCTSSLYAPSCSPLSTSPPSPAQSDAFSKHPGIAAASFSHIPSLARQELTVLDSRARSGPEYEEGLPTSRPKNGFDTSRPVPGQERTQPQLCEKLGPTLEEKLREEAQVKKEDESES